MTDSSYAAQWMRAAVLGDTLAKEFCKSHGVRMDPLPNISIDGGFLVPPDVIYRLERRRASKGWRKHARIAKGAGTWRAGRVSKMARLPASPMAFIMDLRDKLGAFRRECQVAGSNTLDWPSGTGDITAIFVEQSA